MRFFIRDLPHVDDAALVPRKKPKGLRLPDSESSDFVAPDLGRHLDLDSADEPSIVIVSAAGAAGKTTVAREVAQRGGVPLWDLAASGPVGQHSMAGMLLEAFGPSETGKVFDAFERGDFFLVIDALDEARLKVTENAFEAFIQDLAGVAKSSGPGVRFVLLGRTLAAESTWLTLSEAGVDARLLVIEPFSREQSNQYIATRVPHHGDEAAQRMRQRTGPFNAARDAILDRLAEAVMERGDTEPAISANEFIGYPPVLDAVAVLLAGETNYAAVPDRVSLDFGPIGEQGSHQQSALLRRIVEWILDREQDEKLLRNLKPLLETTAAALGWDSWDQLYAPPEQCSRLLELLLDCSLELSLEVPAEIKGDYEAQLDSWLPNHPFLRERDRRQGREVLQGAPRHRPMGHRPGPRVARIPAALCRPQRPPQAGGDGRVRHQRVLPRGPSSRRRPPSVRWARPARGVPVWPPP